ncbi:MAG: hypothetical protein HY975_01050 [Candidatus Kerfeldbacteria bacterium]|nr:hypothetical protein [Candidatus Kerfeldbacteria bacterium]
MKRVFSIFGIASLLLTTSPVLLRAQVAPGSTFNPNLIITDDQLLDTSMSRNRIQEFLNSHNGVLKNYVSSDITGTLKPAAQLIYEAAQAAQINPKFILVILHKEQSLIDDAVPAQSQLDWATGYAFCDSCSSDTPSIQQYRGFGKQVWNSAQLIRRYLNNLQTIGVTTRAIANTWGPGKTNGVLCIDSDFNSGRNICTPGSTILITPANFVTSILYTYTPHPGGNYSFWKIWNGYNFTLTRFYPNGTVLRTKSSSSIYLISNGLKRRFASMSAFLSRYSLNQVITVSADQLAQYDNGQTISFANYSLVSPQTGGVYLLVDDVKRPIKSKQAFLAAGFQNDEVIKVKWSDLQSYIDGEPITPDNIYPSGILMQNKKTGAVFFVKDKIKHGIMSSAIYKSRFGIQKPIRVQPATLATYTDGAMIGFKDGDLVQSKSGGPLYFISNGNRLPIASWAAAQAYGFDKIIKTVIKTDDKSLALHPLGPTLDVGGAIQTANAR